MTELEQMARSDNEGSALARNTACSLTLNENQKTIQAHNFSLTGMIAHSITLLLFTFYFDFPTYMALIK